MSKERGEKSPMVQPGGRRVRIAPTTVEPPSGMGGGSKRGADGEKVEGEKGNGDKTSGGEKADPWAGWTGATPFGKGDGASMGKGFGDMGTGGVTREELYGVLWGMHGPGVERGRKR